MNVDEPPDSTEQRGLSIPPLLAAACLFLAAAGVGFVVYWGSLSNEFVWDDPIVLNQQLQAFHSLGDIFFPPPRIPQFGALYYRPLVMLTYAIDRWAWGDTPFGFHFPVILFHAINCGFVFLVGKKLFGRAAGSTLAAFAGAILFATHPIHTESVSWMAGRSDTLAALFMLPALLAYLAWREGRPPRFAQRTDSAPFGPPFVRTLLANFYLLVAAVLFLMACFSKESGLGFVFLVLAADLFRIVVGPRASEAGDCRVLR